MKPIKKAAFLAARLQVGSNTFRIETGSTFFLSITDENNW